MLGSSSGEVDFYFARILTFTFSLSIECSHMMQALEQSLFIPHKSFIFLCLVCLLLKGCCQTSMFLMFSSRHVKGEYQRLLKMFPVFAENGGIHHAGHFF